MSSSSNQPEQDPKTKALNGYRRRLLEHRELDAKLKESKRPLFHETIIESSSTHKVTSASWFKNT